MARTLELTGRDSEGRSEEPRPQFADRVDPPAGLRECLGYGLIRQVSPPTYVRVDRSP